jgi:hypothetical protein
MAGYSARLWVISAGYGLVPVEATLSSYSATFAFGHDDSVGADPSALSAWWRSLSSRIVAGSSAPRTFALLMKQHPHDIFLVIGSPNYLAAVEQDLISGATSNHRRVRLLVVSSAGGSRARALRPFVIVSGADLQKTVGGARASLHARVARLIVTEAGSHGFELETVRSVCERYRRRGGTERAVSQRARQSDEAVRTYIREALSISGEFAYTTLLRRLRAAGLACEMRRFKKLYAQERGEAAWQLLDAK